MDKQDYYRNIAHNFIYISNYKNLKHNINYNNIDRSIFYNNDKKQIYKNILKSEFDKKCGIWFLKLINNLCRN